MTTQTDRTFCVIKGEGVYKPMFFVLSDRLGRLYLGARSHRIIASGLTHTEVSALCALLNEGEQHE